MGKRRIHSESLLHAVSICSPGVRMVVISVGALVRKTNDGDDPPVTSWHHVDPVLAVRGTIVAEYSRAADPSSGCPPTGATHAEMVELGWSYDGTCNESHCLICEPDHGLCTPEEAACSNTAHRIVACPWPPAEDESRLGPIIKELLADVIEAETKKLAPNPSRAVPAGPPR